MTIIGALSYGELAAMMPHAGGQYVYLREAYGPLAGFLYGWTLFLVIQTGHHRRRGGGVRQVHRGACCRRFDAVVPRRASCRYRRSNAWRSW